MKFNERDWTNDQLHQFRQTTHKPGINLESGGSKRACPFCGKSEIRGCFRNGRCRECRKAQP